MKSLDHVRCCVAVGLALLLSLAPPDPVDMRAMADPILAVTDSGTVNGNQLWRVEVAPDPDLFRDTSEGLGGSLAVELDFLVSNSEIISVTKNAADWPNDNSGFNPFTDGISAGVTVDANTAFVALGSNVFTTGDPVEVITIETLGAGLGTLSWGGRVVSPVGANPYTTARIAQAGTNFDGYEGTLSPGSPLVGDYSGDGLVEQSDLDLVLSNWGTSTPPVPEGWVNDPPVAVIDQPELDRVLVNWGSSTAAAAIPEPATMFLLLLGCGVLPIRMRQR